MKKIMKRSIQDLDLKEGHKYLENQKIRSNKKSRVLSSILSGASIGVIFVGMAFGASHLIDRKQLRKEVYELADINDSKMFEDREIIALGKGLENVSGKNYISLDIDELVDKINKTSNKTYRKFLNKYGNKED